jgi:hypothetical protein
VDRLQSLLEAAEIKVWRDTANLWPGQDWKTEISRAINAGSLVFIACFSQSSVRRSTSYQFEELRLAAEEIRRRPPGQIWLIPARFSVCDLPDFDLGSGRTLDSLQRVDLLDEESWDSGTSRIIATVRRTLGLAAGIGRPTPSSINGIPSERSASPTRTLERISRELTAQMGRRRTAYPLDMSLAQLHEQDLFVPSRIAHYYNKSSVLDEAAVEAIIEKLNRGKSILLLGEPGSGKSQTLYAVATGLSASAKLPLPLRAVEGQSFLQSADWRDLVSREPERAVVLLDGLDEAIGADNIDLDHVIKAITTRTNALVTSRAREYEDILAFETAGVGFDDVLFLQPWSVDIEFAEYLTRLANRGLVDQPHLYRTVVTSSQLSRLVSRPLYARMLTYIGGADAHLVLDRATLYSEYLTKLARTTDFAVRGIPRKAPPTLPTWQATARFLHLHELSADAIPLAALEQNLDNTGDSAAVRRIVDQIIDRQSIGAQEVGEFIHYSLYEYLLARAVTQEIIAADTVEDAIRILRNDLTREVRHFLIGELQSRPDVDLTDTLSRLYSEVRESRDADRADILAVCNLLVYLLSRTSARASECLPRLLDHEREPFLIQSVLWALCYIGWAPALDTFFAYLERDDDFRAICRGYYLYYYGDLKRRAPPFRDSPPYISHPRTSSKILDRISDPAFHALTTEQRCVEMYTFADIYLVRSENLAGHDRDVLLKALADLAGSDIGSRAFGRIEEMIKEVTGGK